MRRHFLVHRIAIALIAAQVLLAVAILWSARRDSVDAVVYVATRAVTPGDLGPARELPLGTRVKVRLPRFFWQSRNELPLEEGGNIPSAMVIAWPPPTERLFIRRAGAEVRAAPGIASRVVDTRSTGDEVTVIPYEAEAISGDRVEYVLSGWRAVVENGTVVGYLDETAVTEDRPSSREWLEAARRAALDGDLKLLAETTDEASRTGDKFAEVLDEELRRAFAHTDGPAIHKARSVRTLSTSLDAYAYDKSAIVERIDHLHEGQLFSKVTRRDRSPNEPLALGYVAIRAAEVHAEDNLATPLVALLPINTEVNVLEAQFAWLKIKVKVTPPAATDIDLTGALTTGAAPTVTQRPLQPPVEVIGYVIREAIGMQPLTPRALRSVEMRTPEKPASLEAQIAAQDTFDLPDVEALKRRLDLAWTVRDAPIAATSATALVGEGRMMDRLDAAELLNDCRFEAKTLGCSAACGVVFQHATATARMDPEPFEGKRRYLYLRLRDVPATEPKDTTLRAGELPLTFVITPKKNGDACGPDDAPRLASVLHVAREGREQDLWVQLPDVPFSSISVVAAKANQALGVLGAKAVTTESPEANARSRTLRFPKPKCEGLRVAAPTSP